MYLTPARVATMGLGVDVSNIEAVALRSAIARASATVDSVCAIPRLPQRHSFRGGVITGERHDWVLDPDERAKANRFYPFHTPVRSVERFDIYSDNTNYVAIDTGGVVINNSGGFLEVASLLLTQYGVFGAGVLPFIGTFHPIADADYTYGYEFAVVDEVAEFVDGQTYQTEAQFWTDAEVTVKVDGATKVITTDYTLDRTEGRVIFTANLVPDAVVTVSYTYSLPWEISQATGMLVAEDLGEASLRGKAMTGLSQLRVSNPGGASVEMERRGVRGGTAAQMQELPAAVQRLLADYVFVTLR